MKKCLPLFIPMALSLGSCMVGPKYQTPSISMPEKYEELHAVTESEETLLSWWEQFNDPTLNALIKEALCANYDLQIALEKIEQTRAQYRIEKSHLWPEIDVNAAAARSRISKNLLPLPPHPTPFGNLFPTNLNTFQLGLDAIWELDFFGKYRHSMKAAYYTWESTKETAESVLISLVSEVIVNYINLRALQQKIALAKRKIGDDEVELKIHQDLFQTGLDNQIAINDLISTLETDRSSLLVLENGYKQTLFSLAFLLGRQPENFAETFQEPRPLLSVTNKIPIGLPSDLLRRRPDVRSAERSLASATELVGSAIADLFPHIALTGISIGAGRNLGSSIGLESATFNKLFSLPSGTFSLGANVAWDMIDFGKLRGQIDMQKSLQKQALLSYEQTVLSALKDVESSLVAFFEEQKRKDSLTEKVAANRSTLEIMKSLNKIGLANALQVLQVEKVLLDAENALVESEQSLAGDLVAIYKALGGQWVLP